MSSTRILITGFEPFLDVRENPSGAMIPALLADPPAGASLEGGVLPVSLSRSAEAFDALLDRSEPPAVVICLGVQRKAYFRLEQRARAALHSVKSDNDGLPAAGVQLEGAPELRTALDLDALSEGLTAGGATDVRISEDAGGFVCERIYHHALTRAAERGFDAVFLHVPPSDAVPVAKQAEIVRAMLARVSASRG